VGSSTRAADAGAAVTSAVSVIATPIGPLSLEATCEGLVEVGFGPRRVRVGTGPGAASARRHLRTAERQVGQYFAGSRRRFTIPLDWSRSEGFRLEVLQELTTVPPGEIVTYGELAGRVGRPGAARAVGTAMATNPLPIVVPCHRVVRAGPRLGGYGGSEDTKRWLLGHEGVRLPD